MKKLLFLLFSALTAACNNPGNKLPRHISETVLVSTVSNDKIYFLITKEDVSLIKDSMSPDKLKRNLRDTSPVVRNMFDNMYDFPLILSVKIK